MGFLNMHVCDGPVSAMASALWSKKLAGIIYLNLVLHFHLWFIFVCFPVYSSTTATLPYFLVQKKKKKEYLNKNKKIKT